MTRNYHRLWQRPHRPHRDSPYPDILSEPVHLYTHRNIHLEEFDPYFVPKSHQNMPTFDPESDHGEATGDEEWEDYESVNSDHYDPRDQPHDDYYDHSNGHYYHDDERHEQRFEPNYDYYEDNFDRQQSQHDYDHDDYECYPDDPEDLDHQFQRLEIGDERPEHDTFGSCNTPSQSHFAYKDVFYHEQAGQHFHIECLECIRYMNQWGFSVPPQGYDYKQHGTHH